MNGIIQSIHQCTIEFPAFVVAVITHEYAHGATAKFWGDKTAEEQGRLTLNPVVHVDPVGTLLLPAVMMLTQAPILFGWAKPVPIDPRRFRKWRLGLFWVALAGPMMNFLIALISALIWALTAKFLPPSHFLYDPLFKMSLASVLVNFALGIFNLIPIPPLDGGRVMESILRGKIGQNYANLARFGFIILMLLMFSGALSYLSYPILLLTNLTLGMICLALGVDLSVL